jgi:hypothetical protein
LLVVVAVELIEALVLVEMAEAVAVALELLGRQLHLLELQILVVAAVAQVSAELDQVHLKVAMAAQV